MKKLLMTTVIIGSFEGEKAFLPNTKRRNRLYIVAD